MVAAWRPVGQVVVERRAAHLRGPDDQGLIQQSASLQVGEQAGDRLIDLVGVNGHAPLDVAMIVPAVSAGPMKDHHEPHPPLDHSPRQQALRTKGSATGSSMP